MERVDDDILTDEKRQLWNLNIEFENDDDEDPDLGNDTLGPYIDDGMDEA